MCVDIFAPGFPITIDFLHERIYFSTAHDTLTAVEGCDVFIRNDDPKRTIDRLRIQFPHSIDWPIRFSAGVEIPPPPVHDREPNWFGSYRALHGDVFEHDPEDGSRKLQGHYVTGEF